MMVILNSMEIVTLVLAIGLMLPATWAMWRWAFFGKRRR